MESIYKPWQWPISIFGLFAVGFAIILLLYGAAMLLYKPGKRTFKEIMNKIGYCLLGVIICLFCAVLIFIGGKWLVQSGGKAAVAILGNYDVVQGYAQEKNMGFSRDMYYSGTFSVDDVIFSTESGGRGLGIAYIKGEEKAELFNNYPIIVKYKRILGMNVIVSIDAITDTEIHNN